MINNEKKHKILITICIMCLFLIPTLICLLVFLLLKENKYYAESLAALFGVIYMLIFVYRASTYAKDKYKNSYLKDEDKDRYYENNTLIRKSQLVLLLSSIYMFLMSFIIYLINK